MVALDEWNFLAGEPVKNSPLSMDAPILEEENLVPECGSPYDSPTSQIDDWLHPPSVDPSLTFGPVLRTFSSMSVSDERAEPFLAIVEEPMNVAAAEAEAETEDATQEDPSLPDVPPTIIPSADVSLSADVEEEEEQHTVPLERPVRPQRPLSAAQRRTISPRAKYSRPASVKASALQASAMKPASRAPPGGVGDLPLSEFRSLLEGMSDEDQNRLKHRRRQEKNSSSQRRSRDRKIQDVARATALARKQDAKRRRANASTN